MPSPSDKEIEIYRISPDTGGVVDSISAFEMEEPDKLKVGVACMASVKVAGNQTVCSYDCIFVLETSSVRVTLGEIVSISKVILAFLVYGLSTTSCPVTVAV